MDQYIIVLITASSEDEAAKIGKDLVDSRLAACVNFVKNIRSIYRWKGNVEDENEVLMIVKTRQSLFNNVTQKVKALHSYSVPEVIALPIIDGSEDYLKWLSNETERP